MSTYVFRKENVLGYPVNRGDSMSEMRLDPKIVGEVIAKYRMKKGLTQEVLRGLSVIGRSHLSAIAGGEREPTLETLYRISLALDVKMSVLVMEIEKELNQQQ